MAKTSRAIAVARSVAETMLTMTALMGPVDKKRQSCAHTMHTRYVVCESVVKAIHTNGAATSVAIADSQRYA
jgi:hypothetical protein